MAAMEAYGFIMYVDPLRLKNSNSNNYKPTTKTSMII